MTFSFFEAKRGFAILNGLDPKTNKDNTNLCLDHNHELYCTIVAGFTEVTSPRDLSVEEKDLLKHCAFANTKMPFVQHSLSIKFGKGTRIYESQMLYCFIADEKKRIFRTNHHRISELTKQGQELIRNGGEF